MSNLVWDCVENLPKALVGVHLLRWIVTYPVNKVYPLFEQLAPGRFHSLSFPLGKC